MKAHMWDRKCSKNSRICRYCNPKKNIVTLSKYILLKKLGKGYTSNIYLGYDKKTENYSALKILKP